MIRQLIGLAFGVLLVSLGLWLGYEELFAAVVIQLRMLVAVAFLLGVGGYVCWSILGEFRKAR